MVRMSPLNPPSSVATRNSHVARRPIDRWRAVGAAIAIGAISIGSISAWRVSAASQSESSFVPIAPCRVFDTRPGNEPEGGKKSPLGSGDANVHIQQIAGTVGNCQIPPDATAVSMNVTAVNPTAQSNLRVFPADVSTPTVSNLNWVADQAPTPNKVDVQLSPGGAIKLYNQNGTVDVVADVVGYYTQNGLDEMRRRLDDLESRMGSTAREQTERIDAVEAIAEGSALQVNDIAANAPFAVAEAATQPMSIAMDRTTTLEMAITAPVDGDLTVNFSAVVANSREYTSTWCSVFKQADIPSASNWFSGSGVALEMTGTIALQSGTHTLAASKVLALEANEPTAVVLVCEANSNAVSVFGRTMTAVFSPAQSPS